MTIARLISIDTRSGLLVALGTALLLGPVAIGLSAASMVTGVVVGAFAIGLGLAGTATYGRGTIPVTAHLAYDQGLAVGLMLTAVAFLVAGEPLSAAVFAGAGLLQALVGSLTSYSAKPAS